MAEPISLALFKQHLRVTSDLEDELLGVYLSAARKSAEDFTGQYYVDQTVAKTFPANQNCAIPASAILTVTGFYDSVEALVNAESYYNEYRKGTIVSRERAIDADNMPTYTVTYAVAAQPVPSDVIPTILKLGAYLYENREANSAAALSGQAYQDLFAAYRVI